jgi:hypothetical protein
VVRRAHLGCLLADPGVLSRLPPPQRLGILLVARYSGRCRTSRAAQQPPHGAGQLGRTPGDRAALSAPSPPSGIDPHGPSGAVAEQHPSGSTVERLPITLVRAEFVLGARATRVPHRTDNHGAERTTTVTDMSPVTWPPNALAAWTHPTNMPDKDEIPGSSSGRLTSHSAPRSIGIVGGLGPLAGRLCRPAGGSPLPAFPTCTAVLSVAASDIWCIYELLTRSSTP